MSVFLPKDGWIDESFFCQFSTSVGFSSFTEVQEPYAVVVLLEKDLIVVDLTQSKYVMQMH